MDGGNLEKVKAAEIMSRDVKVVQEDTPVAAIIELLEESHLIRVPVVKEGSLAGMLARRDVLFGYIKATDTYWP